MISNAANPIHVAPDNLQARSQQRAERDAMKALAEEARNLARSLSSEISIVPVVTAGSAATEIARCSAETKAEMIVLGRVGRSSVSRKFPRLHCRAGHP